MQMLLFTILLQSYFSSVVSLDDVPTISWNVSAIASAKKGHVNILNNVQGFARKGKLHAIMGPSGSGKSTLLNVLANAVPKKSLELTGEMLTAPSSQLVYVQQEDILFSQLTVEETLDTSATLRLKETAKKDVIVEKLMNNLNLKKAKGTKVGDAKTRGISGGEKKRLCIGNECIGTSAKLAMNDNGQAGNTIIFADEPTSGLDSYQAQRAVELLKDLATNGECTVIASVHQPRASIVALFDDITLVAEGSCIYTGSAKEMPVWGCQPVDTSLQRTSTHLLIHSCIPSMALSHTLLHTFYHTLAFSHSHSDIPSLPLSHSTGSNPSAILVHLE